MPEDLVIAAKAIDLILQFEGFAPKIEYPGGASGGTGGFGYDFAYHKPLEIRTDWGPHLAPRIVERLVKLCDVTGAAAKAVVPGYADVYIPRAAAERVFHDVDVPRWIRRTRAAYPGYEHLPDELQGALVSLTFNRGVRMSDRDERIEERRELRAIRGDVVEYVKHPDLRSQARKRIAWNLRSMSRLWVGNLPHPYDVKMTGLIRRREAEAMLVEAFTA